MVSCWLVVLLGVMCCLVLVGVGCGVLLFVFLVCCLLFWCRVLVVVGL